MEPGQRAYEAWATHWGQMGPWSSLKDDFRAAWAAVEAACVPEASGQRVRHVKRGTTYDVVGVAVAQVSNRPRTLDDFHRLVVYRGKDGKLWCRFEDEFNDGRFEAVEGGE